MNIIEVLIVIAISLMIMGFFIPTLMFKLGKDHQAVAFKVMAIRMVKRTFQNGILKIVDKGRMIIVDIHKPERIVYQFPFSFLSKVAVDGEDITFKNGFVSTAGTVYGDGWWITVEPVTGRMRLYGRR
ncbi:MULTISPECIES: hypothetical protein [unclassified Thermotoga]|uniref:hypothetical protein n=1 Tax=unclassified Thermotoga TaxID=2631113 RepID=UPI000280EB29|nr:MULTISPECIES: hypothetical protein [unclassified Thermotoga]AIY86411.1 hypothetical protein T2812B_04330 [Thermotoga sp. 2812B]EJX26347.1 hypothetical protein EMP_04955 [Thermotoga sp. EMP]